MRDLAKRLLDAEAANQPDFEPHVHEGVRVCEKLRVSLTRFAGIDGFTALMRRALALARTEAPSLQTVTVGSEGSIEGLEAISAESGNAGAEATTALVSHLLELLTIFVGESLTLRLVSDAWPDATSPEEPSIAEKS